MQNSARAFLAKSGLLAKVFAFALSSETKVCGLLQISLDVTMPELNHCRLR